MHGSSLPSDMGSSGPPLWLHSRIAGGFEKEIHAWISQMNFIRSPGLLLEHPHICLDSRDVSVSARVETHCFSKHKRKVQPLLNGPLHQDRVPTPRIPTNGKTIFLFSEILFFFFNLAALGLHCCLWAFSSCRGYSLFAELGLLIVMASRCRAQALREAGLSNCSWRVLEHRLSSWWCMSLVTPKHVESSQIKNRTCIPCIGRRTPNHWTTREVLHSEILDQ